MAAGAVEASAPLLEAAGLVLEVHVGAPDTVLDAYDARLAQLLTNVLNTAAKFTPRGRRVALRSSREGDRLRLVVSDTGIGLAPPQLESIFEMFVRGAASGAHGGLGIGLTLAHRRVELHGGRLWAEIDGPDRGSGFVVELPAAEAGTVALSAAPDAGRADTPPRRVRAVDDNVDAVQTLAALLELEGHDVRTAFSGDAALTVLDGFAPEVALVDIGLPGMSGYELAGRLRADPRSAAARRVAVTGRGREQDRERTPIAGVGAHLTRPVDPAAVLAWLDA